MSTHIYHGVHVEGKGQLFGIGFRVDSSDQTQVGRLMQQIPLLAGPSH